MGHPEHSFKTPTRIPRPTSMAASPRSPSIRTVPYNHTDRAVHASWAPGSYSPTNWPFPKSSKYSSMDLSTTTGLRYEAHNSNTDTMNDNSTTRPIQQGIAIGPRVSSLGGTRDQASRDRASSGHESVVTQIYAPRHSNATVSVAPSQSNSVRGSFLEVNTEIPERPMSPTPYSPLQKPSEPSPLEDKNDSVKPQHEERLSAARRNLLPSLRRSQEPVTPDLASNTSSIAATMGSPNHPRSVSSSVSCGQDSPSLASALSLFRSSITSNRSRKALDTNDNNTSPSNHSAPSSANATVAHSTLPGIAIFHPPEDPKPRAASTAARFRTTSIHSTAQATVREDLVPDLGSIRRGPRLRHSRLPPSPSLPAAAHGWQVPRSAREIWGIVDRLWNMMLISAIFLEFSILSFVSSITAVIMAHTEHPEGSEPRIGLVAWVAVSSTFVATFGVLLTLSILQYRKTSKNLVSGENWIEMHRRSRPLPARPEDGEVRKRDSAVTEAWQKFAQDHEQLRRYVEFLENRVGVLEEQRAKPQQQGEESKKTGSAQPRSGAGKGAETRAENGDDDNNDGGSTPKAKKLYVGGSLSRRKLLQREDTATETWHEGDPNAIIPKSDTKASILTELCEAVTEGYSPLCEQMPRASVLLSQASPNTNTPSGRPRDDTLHRAAVHQRGVRSMDILGGKVDGI